MTGAVNKPLTFRATAISRRKRPGAQMSEPGWLTDQFEHWRPHLTSVAYGMLGSVSEAEDGVQQAWLRLGRSESEAIIDLRAWLTTVSGGRIVELDLVADQAKLRHLAIWR
jgi:DNA-directed RNA polymerase specialized sigma24 family protein